MTYGMTLRIEDIEKLHLALVGALAMVAVISGWLGAGSVLLGGGLMALNVWLIKQMA